MAAPTVLTPVGVAASGVGAITPALPAVTFQDGDVIFGIGESVAAFPNAATNGFVHLDTISPVIQDTNTRLTVIWQRWTAGLTAHNWGDSGDHNIGAYIAIRGLPATGNPWHVVAAAVDATLDNSALFPNPANTTVVDCLVLLIGGWSTAMTVAAAPVNAALTSITERIDATTTAGADGAIYCATGIKAAAGAIGTSTATLSGTAFKAMMTLALAPSVAITHAVAGSASSTSTAAGELTIIAGGAILAVAGAASSTSVAAAAVTVYSPVAGAATSTSTAAVDLTRVTPLAGAATSTSIAAGAASTLTPSPGFGTGPFGTGPFGDPVTPLAVSGAAVSVSTAAAALLHIETNSAEGGSDGTAATTANTGGASGNAFDRVVLGTSGTVTFDNAWAAHGSLSYEIVPTVAGGSACYVGGDVAAATSFAIRAYARLDVLPSTGTQFLRLLSNEAGTNVGNLFVSSNGSWGIQNAAGATVYQSAAALLTAGNAYRFEYYAVVGAGTGQARGAVYVGDSTTPLDDSTLLTGQANGAAAIAAWRAGKSSNAGTWNPLHIDDIAWAEGATGFIGPATGGVTHAVSGAATSVSASAGALVALGALTGAAISTSTAVASLTLVTPLAGAAASTSTAAGALTIVSGAVTHAVAGAATSTSSAAAAVTLRGAVLAAAISTSVAAGAVTLQGALSAAAVSTSLASAELTPLGMLPLAGTATSTSTAAGALTLRGALTGAASSTSVAAGTLVLRMVIPVGSAAASSTSSASAAIGLLLPLAGAASSTSVAAGALTRLVPLSGVAVSVSTTAAALTVIAAPPFTLGVLTGISGPTSVLTGSATTI